MRIYLDSIGCRLNQAEIEIMGRQLRAAGHEIVASAAGADRAVVNTCAVTAKAASDSRGAVRRIAREGVVDIAVTGCWATLNRRQAASLPGVRHVVHNSRKEHLVTDVLDLPAEEFELEPVMRRPLPGLHHRTRAFIKVQDGCNNHCTFCVTTVARGESASRHVEDVIDDVQFALAGGSKEIVLTGVHLGSWGQDFGMHLSHLIQAILRETDVGRLRLSSLEPWDLDAEFFRIWQDGRLCRHLHLPLQSGCATILKRMARKTTPESFRKLIQAARAVMPEVAITTDVIAGFPGESDGEFAESVAFVKEMNFAGGHAFTYSARSGTGAARLSGQVPPQIRRERSVVLREAFAQSAADYRQGFIGQQLPVLWESTTQLDEQGWQISGLTDNYLRVAATATRPMWNEISLVELWSVQGEGLAGRIAA